MNKKMMTISISIMLGTGIYLIESRRLSAMHSALLTRILKYLADGSEPADFFFCISIVKSL